MNYGHFKGQVKTRWLKHKGGDRKMELLEDFAYVDPAGEKWVATKGSVIDGASIPQIFWTAPIGSHPMLATIAAPASSTTSLATSNVSRSSRFTGCSTTR